MSGVSVIQNETLNYISEFLRKNDYSPSIREIAGRFDISINAAHKRLEYMRKKDLITWTTGRARTIRLV